jgi:hypothetical protein
MTFRKTGRAKNRYGRADEVQLSKAPDQLAENSERPNQL